MSHCYQVSALRVLTEGLEYAEGVLVADLPEGRIALAHAWNVSINDDVDNATLLPVLRSARLTYVEVRRGTELTIAELNDRGNPDDLEALANDWRNRRQ
jgi:hypothetical protein